MVVTLKTLASSLFFSGVLWHSAALCGKWVQPVSLCTHLMAQQVAPKRLELTSSSQLTFQDLPHDLQYRILSELKYGKEICPCSLDVARVCQHWRDFVFSQCTKLNVVVFLSRCSRAELSCSRLSKKILLNVLVDALPSIRNTLREIGLGFVRDPTNVGVLFKCCAKLDENFITNEMIRSLFRFSFPRLQVLTLCGSTSFTLTDAAVLAATRSSPMLTEFCLKDYSIRKLHHISLPYNAEECITYASIRYLKQNCKHLKVVTLFNLAPITEHGFTTLGQISSLQSISLHAIPHINDKTIEAICWGLCSISELSIHIGHLLKDPLTDRSSKAIACGRATRASLQKLDLEVCDRITSAGLCEILRYCTQLAEIVIIFNESVKTALIRFTELYPGRKLQLRALKCEAIGDLRLSELRMSCIRDAETITNLELKEGRDLTSAHLQLLPNTKSLQVSVNSNLEQDMKGILRLCPCLKTLSVKTDINLIGKKISYAIVDILGSQLVKLSISAISSEALVVITKGCRNLQELHLGFLVTAPKFKEIQKMTSARVFRPLLP